jgi:hypothetical protein
VIKRIVRGTRPCVLKALRKKALAAAASRLGLRRKSTVLPRPSTARYRYVHRPRTLMYLSSTRHEPPIGRAKRFQRFSNSGAYCCSGGNRLSDRGHPRRDRGTPSDHEAYLFRVPSGVLLLLPYARCHLMFLNNLRASPQTAIPRFSAFVR